MNFLGHLYFSRDNTKLMTANLFGDFVKGKDLSHFQPITQQGIRLHRSIDHFIDHHPVVVQLLQELYSPLPKVAGIAVDLYFDHLLAKHWKQFHATPLDEFIRAFYASVEFNHPDFSEEFKRMMKKMIEKNWLYQYQFSHGLYKACLGVSNRISFENELHKGLTVFKDYEENIQTVFYSFMENATIHFNQLEIN